MIFIVNLQPENLSFCGIVIFLERREFFADKEMSKRFLTFQTYPLHLYINAGLSIPIKLSQTI